MFRKTFFISNRIVTKRCMHISCKSNIIHQKYITLTPSRILSATIYSKRDFSAYNYFKKIISVNAATIDRKDGDISGINEATLPATGNSQNIATSAVTPIDEANIFATSQNETLNMVSDHGIQYIPPPPAIPEAMGDLVNAVGERTFSSMDLITWSPVGGLIRTIEFLHVSTGMPWWATIAIMTISLRIMVFPLVLSGIRNSIKFSNHAPTYMKMQKSMHAANLAGDLYNAAKLTEDMRLYQKKHGISQFKTMVQPLMQAPVFITMFMSLLRCAELPVESFKTGGILWFHDLTVCDPYYILPAMAATTTFLTLKLGMKDGSMGYVDSAGQGMVMKVLLYGLPAVIFPVTSSFPAAMVCYWVTTNAVTFLQTAILRIDFVKKTLNLPEKVIHPPSNEPSKSFRESFVDIKKAFKSQKLAAEVQNRMREDAVNFRKAGTGPVPKTYAYNPTAIKRVIDGHPNSQWKVKQ